ncbi:MAG: 6-pyruvoyl tetrahydropterin synthase family protein [Euryarchaeota archaeon]|nr:6-pyruvoyl tetrahydropterin synthase family protein [Euryarchaeota archaeon]
MHIEIDGWKVGIRFSASHFIPGHHKCARLHGHDYGVRVRIYGETKDCMLYDFVELKKIVRKIADEIDHHVMIPRSQEFIKHHINGNEVSIEFDGKRYTFPAKDVVFLDLKLTTAEELARYFAKKVLQAISFPANVKGFEICVDEGPGQGACHYEEVSA